MPTIIDAVKLAERFVRGAKRGPEKKELATGFVVDVLKENLANVEKAQMPDFRTINWLKLILAAPELIEKVGDVIDAVVALMNFLGQFDERPDAYMDPH